MTSQDPKSAIDDQKIVSVSLNIISGKYTRLHTHTVSMYLLPLEEAASGPTKSIDIHWNENIACTEARVPICCGLALLDLAWHGLHLRTNSATIRFIPVK
jgi:hypothetical protein